MGTAHNQAEKGQIAKTVLMPGDPLRAKYIAETYLEDPKCFNEVRGMLGYTGKYKGKEVSVMGSGMGMPSIGIYSYELYDMYGVETIIRIGSAGSLQDDVNVREVVIGMGACTNSNYASQYKLPGTFAPISTFELVKDAVDVSEELGVKYHVGNVLSSDTFYSADTDAADKWKDMGIIAIEMESAALYMNAAKLNKKALGIFTISDHIYKNQDLSAQERQVGFNDMMKVALEVAIKQ